MHGPSEEEKAAKEEEKAASEKSKPKTEPKPEDPPADAVMQVRPHEAPDVTRLEQVSIPLEITLTVQIANFSCKSIESGEILSQNTCLIHNFKSH
jgi:hypothetical protein